MEIVGVVPYVTELFGMVMLLNPVVPLTPVTAKETVVVVADWFVVIMMLVICDAVMFPVITSLTFVPLAVAVTSSVGVGVGVVLGLGVAVGVEPEVGEGEEVGVEVEVVDVEFTVIETALEANEIGIEALSVTSQVIECEDPAAE